MRSQNLEIFYKKLAEGNTDISSDLGYPGLFTPEEEAVLESNIDPYSRRYDPESNERLEQGTLLEKLEYRIQKYEEYLAQVQKELEMLKGISQKIQGQGVV